MWPHEPKQWGWCRGCRGVLKTRPRSSGGQVTSPVCVCRVETGEGGGRLLSLVYSWGVSKMPPPLIADTQSMSRPLSLLYTQSKLSVLLFIRYDFYHIANWTHCLIKKSVHKPNFVHLKLKLVFVTTITNVCTDCTCVLFLFPRQPGAGREEALHQAEQSQPSSFLSVCSFRTEGLSCLVF